MQDGLQAMVARIDERTKGIKDDVGELKNTCMALERTVNGHSAQLATITEQIKNSNHGLSKRQTAGIGGGAGAVIGGVIAFLIEFFKH